MDDVTVSGSSDISELGSGMTPQMLGAAIRQERARMRVTQADVAAALGVSRVAVVEMEAGRRKVSARELWRLSRLFGVSTDRLLGLEVEPVPGVEAVLAAAAGLSEGDRYAVRRFAEFLAAAGPAPAVD